MYVERLKRMFDEMVIKKDISKLSHYYHPEFLLYTNEQTMDYKYFFESHEKIYATAIEYQIEYDEETFLEQNEKIAGRVWITTKRPAEAAKKIEVILIAQFKENKIYRIWELTYPDWSQLPAFNQRGNFAPR